jgi:hypothetical protein
VCEWTNCNEWGLDVSLHSFFRRASSYQFGQDEVKVMAHAPGVKVQVIKLKKEK